MIHTPGGIRCPDCAQLRRPPMYELSRMDYARALGAAVALAVALGFVGALLIPPGRGFRGFFLIFVFLIGSGAGTLVAEGMRRATNGKRGQAMQAIAVGAIAVAGLLRIVLAGAPLDIVLEDLAGLILLGAAVFAAWGRLR